MCIGVPMRLLSRGPGRALGEGRGQRETLDLMLVGDQPVGTWVLAFRGTAMRVLSADEADKTNAALDALEAVLAGEGDIDAHFADLVDREPMLPEHLNGGSR
ncbi:MAG: HypC/HybG/HupF family hydrogenase formation chaperone [Casimicrobiaceae bacterium]